MSTDFPMTNTLARSVLHSTRSKVSAERKSLIAVRRAYDLALDAIESPDATGHEVDVMHAARRNWTAALNACRRAENKSAAASAGVNEILRGPNA